MLDFLVYISILVAFNTVIIAVGYVIVVVFEKLNAPSKPTDV